MPVAVELNGLLPGLGPGRGAPGRGPEPPGLGAPGRGAPDPWVLGADGRAPWPPWTSLARLVGTARGGAWALPARAAWPAATGSRRPGWDPLAPLDSWPPLTCPRAAEVGRGGRGPWRSWHPRGAGSARSPLGPRLGRPGPGRGRRRDRRQPASRIGGPWTGGGPARDGAIGHGRAIRGAVGRPVGGGPGRGRAPGSPGSRSGGRSGAVVAGGRPRTGVRSRSGTRPGANPGNRRCRGTRLSRGSRAVEGRGRGRWLGPRPLSRLF